MSANAGLALPRDFRCAYGVLEPVSPLIRRIVARNPGPFTFVGTGTYVVGHGRVAVIDPGPALAEHVESLLEALDGETVTHILVTHTHLDHSPAASVLRQRTGAPTLGFGPHGGDRDGGSVEAGADRDFVPEIILRDGDAVDGADWRLEAVHTPGHTSNHLCFALPQEAALFTGDHVMGWSTSVIAPPDGNMAAYMLALERLLTRPDAIYWPTHGGPIREPHAACPCAHHPSQGPARRDPRCGGAGSRNRRDDRRQSLCRSRSAPGRRGRALGPCPPHRAGRGRGHRQRRPTFSHREKLVQKGDLLTIPLP